MIVMKFGGTSTQDAAAMRNVAQIIKARLSLRPIVVVSAIAKATNSLEQAGKLSALGKREEARVYLKTLIDRHFAILNENIKNAARHDELHSLLSQSFRELEELVHGVSILRELTPRALDAFYCYGELMSSRLVAATLAESGVNTAWLDTKDFMVTDDNFNAALPMMDIVALRLNRLLAQQEPATVCVTQGFIGVTGEGYRTTMGRESSDYSAAVVGAALDAEDVQIWTDVDGILTGDPTVIDKPKKVKEMSFHEAYDLSFFGAKVLHPNTMLPALEKNIPIHIYNSRKPHLSGSLVASVKSSNEARLKSVTSMDGIAVLQISPSKRFSQYIFWEHLFSILTKHRALARLTATSEYNIAVALDDTNVIPAIVHDIEGLGSVTVHGEMGIVSLVGMGIQKDTTLLRKVFNAAGSTPVSMISYGASGCNLSFVVPQQDVLSVVKNIHREFFENGLPSELFEELEPVPVTV
jgi:aspartate kinase